MLELKNLHKTFNAGTVNEKHALVGLSLTLEDGEVNGGLGEKVAAFYGTADMKVLNFGSKKEFTDRVPLEALYRRYRLTPELIVQDIEKYL